MERGERTAGGETSGGNAEAGIVYKIHPGIGVACVGDSPTDWHIAPETVEIQPVPPGGYRDAEGRIKPLGARFRVFQYDDLTGALIGEVNASTGHVITWHVNLRDTHPPSMALSAEEMSTIAGAS